MNKKFEILRNLILFYPRHGVTLYIKQKTAVKFRKAANQ